MSVRPMAPCPKCGRQSGLSAVDGGLCLSCGGDSGSERASVADVEKAARAVVEEWHFPMTAPLSETYFHDLVMALAAVLDSRAGGSDRQETKPRPRDKLGTKPEWTPLRLFRRQRGERQET